MADNHGMQIVAVGWLYVVALMAFTEGSVVAGMATFLFYGLAPLALLLYLMGTPQRRRDRRSREAPAAADACAAAEVPPPARTASPLQPDEPRHPAADAVTPVAPEAVAVGDRAGAGRSHR